MPPDYERYFQSFDGKARKLIVEGPAGRAGSPNTTCSRVFRPFPLDASPLQ